MLHKRLEVSERLCSIRRLEVSEQLNMRADKMAGESTPRPL